LIETNVITGSIARSATRRYLSYSEADYDDFRSPLEVKFGTEEGTVPNFTPTVQR